jgi:hypothetical protein
MEVQPLKKALPECGIPSLFAMLSAPSKLIVWPEGMSTTACIAMAARVNSVNGPTMRMLVINKYILCVLKKMNSFIVALLEIDSFRN